MAVHTEELLAQLIATQMLLDDLKSIPVTEELKERIQDHICDIERLLRNAGLDAEARAQMLFRYKL